MPDYVRVYVSEPSKKLLQRVAKIAKEPADDPAELKQQVADLAKAVGEVALQSADLLVALKTIAKALLPDVSFSARRM